MPCSNVTIVATPSELGLESGLPEIDITKPHTARIYDYLLGGKDNFAADRTVGEQSIKAWPGIRVAARENRAFVGRAVRYLATEAGIDQFLDIGSGLPTASNVHEIAQAVNPSARVVYVDNDPIVHAHSRALLISSPEGECAYIHADLRAPEKILGSPALRETLDFSRPIALILAAVLHFLSDEEKPGRIIGTLVDALPPGSYVAATHGTLEYHEPGGLDGSLQAYLRGGMATHTRDSGEFGRLVFAGLELVSPGIVLMSEWRPDADGPRPLASEVGGNAGVARKP
jgi:hypothetical protein